MPVTILSLFFIMLLAADSSAANSMTLYSDGTIFTIEASALKGVIETPIAAGLIDGTLKVDPVEGATIVNVETSPARLDSKSDKELESLTEQRQRLEDRMKALATREEIFKAAAKSQSGKAPRKTKSNPDPMQTIRLGTDFAIAQLETVYTNRRKTEQEIKKIDAKIASAKKNARSQEIFVRIAVTPMRGRVIIRYATSDRGWHPYYYIHLAGDGFAAIQYFGKIVGNSGGYILKASPASLAESATSSPLPSVQGGKVKFGIYRFPLSEERYGEGIYNSFSVKLANTSQQHLPSGEAGLYKKGAYLGKMRFEGISSGRDRIIKMGSR